MPRRLGPHLLRHLWADSIRDPRLFLLGLYRSLVTVWRRRAGGRVRGAKRSVYNVFGFLNADLPRPAPPFGRVTISSLRGYCFVRNPAFPHCSTEEETS